MTQPRVIVIGAGIAGLAAAFTLQKRGYGVEVLEREVTPGGRMRSEVRDGYVVERGAQFIASSYRHMRALARELGISDLIRPLGETRNAVLKNGRFVLTEYDGLRAFQRSRDLSLVSKLRLLRIVWPLLRERSSLDFYRPELASHLDDADAASYTRRMFGQEVLDYLVEPAFAGTFTVLPENMSRAFMLSTIATLFRGFRLLSFQGGNGVPTSTLASRVTTRTSTDVVRITEDDTSVEVTTSDGERHRAEAAVIAVPGNAVANICPELTPEERRFFAGVRYASSIIVFVKAGRAALPPFYGAGIPQREGVRLYGIAVENAKPGAVPPGKTLFNCAFSEDLAAGLIDASDDDVVAALETELQKLPLAGLDTIEGYEVHRWPSLVPQFYPGYHRAIREFLHRSERSRRIAFAGDYLVGPYTEAALASGLRAADEIGRSISAPSP